MHPSSRFLNSGLNVRWICPLPLLPVMVSPSPLPRVEKQPDRSVGGRRGRSRGAPPCVRAETQGTPSGEASGAVVVQFASGASVRRRCSELSTKSTRCLASHWVMSPRRRQAIFRPASRRDC